MSTATPAVDTHAEQVPGPPSPALFQLTVGAWASHAIATAARPGLADAPTDGPPSCDDPTIEEPGPSDVTKTAPAEQPPAGHGRARRSADGSRVHDGGNRKYRVAAGCPARHQRRPAVGDSARVS